MNGFMFCWILVAGSMACVSLITLSIDAMDEVDYEYDSI